MTAPTEAAAPPSREAQRMVRWSLLAVSANLLLMAVSPWGAMATLVTGPIGVTLCIIALVKLMGVTRIKGLRVILSLGIAASAYAVLYGAAAIVLKEPLDNYAECRDRAITHSAQRECTEQYERDYTEFLEGFGVTLP